MTWSTPTWRAWNRRWQTPQSALAKAQADVLAQQQDQSYKDQLAKLVNAEATPTTTYTAWPQRTRQPVMAPTRIACCSPITRWLMRRQHALSYELQPRSARCRRRRRCARRRSRWPMRRRRWRRPRPAAISSPSPRPPSPSRTPRSPSRPHRKPRPTSSPDQTPQPSPPPRPTSTRRSWPSATPRPPSMAPSSPLPLTAPSSKSTSLPATRSAANTTILTLADLKTVQVVASIDETTIRKVSAGQDATITFDAYPGQTFKGKVQSVPLQGSLQGGVMVYSVPISLTGADKLSLLVGMTANVKIQAGTATQALLVPTLALTEGQRPVPGARAQYHRRQRQPERPVRSASATAPIPRSPRDSTPATRSSSRSSRHQQQPAVHGRPGMDMGGAPPAPPSGSASREETNHESTTCSRHSTSRSRACRRRHLVLPGAHQDRLGRHKQPDLYRRWWP